MEQLAAPPHSFATPQSAPHMCNRCAKLKFSFNALRCAASHRTNNLQQQQQHLQQQQQHASSSSSIKFSLFGAMILCWTRVRSASMSGLNMGASRRYANCRRPFTRSSIPIRLRTKANCAAAAAPPCGQHFQPKAEAVARAEAERGGQRAANCAHIMIIEYK